MKQATAKIIFGQPEAEDAFPGGGHERSARALAESIEQIVVNGDATGQHGGGIGLEGGWGAGKSSVIRMAEKGLPDRYRVLAFDMWSHQTDAFRRAFLEELINYAERNKADWPDVNIRDEREIVQSRRRHVRDNTRKLYTPLGALLLLVLPFIAILFAWIQPSAFGNANLGNLPGIAFWSLVGVFIAAGIVLGVFFIRADASHETRWWAKPLTKFALAVSEFFTVSRDVSSQTTTQSIREEDPTTVEFNRIFRDLLGKLQTHERRFIFVLDNADRLPAEQVKSAWSEMRALFATPTDKPEHTVLAVVPYDRKHISDAFGLGNSGASLGESDIFEKTFDRIIAVAPPVPSDWRGYLDRQLNTALEPHATPSEREKLFRLFKLHLVERKVRVTPRRIIAYVNDIGALRVQWGDAIPLEAMALYALHRQAIDGADDVIAGIGSIGTQFQHIVDLDDWRKYIAALTFNVEPEHANQVLFEPVIAAGLTDTDPEALKKVSMLPGFWEVFHDVLSDSLKEWASSNNIEAMDAASTNVVALDPPSHVAEPAWREFAERLEQITITEDSLIHLDALERIVGKQQARSARRLAEEIERKLLAAEAADETAIRSLGLNWAKLVSGLADSLMVPIGQDAGKQFWSTRKMLDDPNFVIGVAEACTIDDRYSFNDLSGGVLDGELSNAFVKLLDTNADLYERCQPLLREKVKGNVAEHLDVTVAHLQANTGDTPTLISIAASYCRWYPSAAVNSLRPAWKDGTLAWLAYGSETAEEHHEAGQAIFLALMVAETAIPANRTFNAQLAEVAEAVTWYNGLFTGAELASETQSTIASLFTGRSHFSKLLSVSIDGGDTKGFQGALLEAASSSQILPLSIVSDKYGQIEKILGEETTSSLLAQASNSTSDIEKQLSGLDIVKVSDEFIGAASQIEGQGVAIAIIEAIDKKHSSLTADQWITVLTTPGNDELRVFLKRRETGAENVKGSDFVTAMAEVAAQTLSGSFNPEDVGARYHLVEGAIPRRSVSQVAALLVPKISSISSSPVFAERFVKHFPIIAAAMKLDADKQTANAVLGHLIWFLVGADSGAGKQYIDKQAGQIKAALQIADANVVERFEQAVQEVTEKDDDRGQRLETAFFGKRKKGKQAEPDRN